MSSDIEFIKLDVAGRIEEMAAKLNEQDPLLPVHLSAIHSTLISYEELVHMLDDEQIKKLVAAQARHVGVQLVKETIAKKSGPKTVKRGESIADDL